MKTKLASSVLLLGVAGLAHANMPCAPGQQIGFCPSQGNFTYSTPSMNDGARTVINANASVQDGTWQGRAEFVCSNGRVTLASQTCTFKESTPVQLTGNGSQSGGTTTTSAGTAVTQTSIQGGDPCASPSAQSIFSSRMGAAQKQSAATNKELNKTVSNPIIAEGAIKNARSCNDMVRDALSSVFEGTPLGNLMSLFGLDQQACDALYDFQNEVESEFDTTAIEDAIALAEEASSISGSDPTFGSAIGGIVGGAVNILPGGSSSPSTTETAPTSTPQLVGQWRETGRYTPCTYENGQSIEYMIYQCVDDTNAVILTSYCQDNPPRASRTCSSISNSGGGVNNAIY
jgi:hypothetical protein